MVTCSPNPAHLRLDALWGAVVKKFRGTKGFPGLMKVGMTAVIFVVADKAES